MPTEKPTPRVVVTKNADGSETATLVKTPLAPSPAAKSESEDS